MKLSKRELLEIVRSVVAEEIRKVKGGYKVYPKKPRKGEKRRKAFSKKPMSYKKALSQLRAIERSKAMSEDIIDKVYEAHSAQDPSTPKKRKKIQE